MAERAQIDTPEHVAFSLELADLGSRFLAIAIDTAIQGVIVGGVAFVLLVVFAAMAQFRGRPIGDANISPVPFLIIFLATVFFTVWGYHIGFETWGRGQSPGKRAIGLRVLKDNGAPEGFLDATIRNLVRVVDMLPAGYAVGVVSILCTKQHKRLGDMAAGALVVREPRPRTPGGPTALDPKLRRLLSDFMDRAAELDPAARDAIALDLATRLGLPEAPDPGAALTALARLRSQARAVG